MVAIPKTKKGTLISSLQTGDYLPHLAIYAVVVSTVSALAALSLAISFANIAKKKDPVLVQTHKGPIQVQAEHHLSRSPQSIQDFVGRVLSLSFNWTGKTIDEYGAQVKDKGVDFGRQNRISTLAYETAGAFTTDSRLRSQVLEKIAEWSDPAYLQGTKQHRIEIKKITLPRKLKRTGHWSVGVVANRVITQERNTEVMTFNRKLYLRAIPVIEDPFPEGATPESRASFNIRQYGLEIYRMEKFTREDV